MQTAPATAVREPAAREGGGHVTSFGGYELGRKLHEGALATVWEAWPPGVQRGWPRRVVVKSAASQDLFFDRTEADKYAQSFLDAARAQYRVFKGGAEHWAPIHQFASTEEGTFYVTDYYEHSVKQLAYGRVRLSGPALHHILASVVKGLLELKEICGRPHGNLKPTNVLLSRAGDVRRTGVFLTDPRPAGTMEVHEAGVNDIRALGELIYQLVLHKSPEAMHGRIVPRTAAWDALGKNGDAWRELCSRLLLWPESLTVERVAEEAEKLREFTAPSWLPKLVLGCVAAAVALGVLSTLLRKDFPQEKWDFVCDEYGRWVSTFLPDMTPERLRAWSDEPHLKAVALRIAEAEKDGIKLSPFAIAGARNRELSDIKAKPPEQAQSPDGIRDIERTYGLYQDIRKAFSIEGWPALSEANARAEAWEARKWNKPAACLRELVDTVTAPRPCVARAADAVAILGGQGALESVRRLCSEYEEWFGAFLVRAGSRRGLWATDPGLKKVVEALAAAEGQEILYDPRERGLCPGLNIGSVLQEASVKPAVAALILRATGALAVIDGVNDALTPQKWTTLREVRDVADTWSERRWSGPAEFLRARVAAAKPSPQLADAVEAILGLHAALEKLRPALDSAWKSIGDAEKPMTECGDPVLKRFGEYAAARAGSAEDLRALGEALEAVQRRAGDLDGFLKSEWDNVDRVAFWREGTVFRSARGPVTGDTLTLWLDEARQHVRVYLPPLDAERATLARLELEAERLQEKCDQSHKKEVADWVAQFKAQGLKGASGLLDEIERLAHVRRNERELKEKLAQAKLAVGKLPGELAEAYQKWFGDPRQWLRDILAARISSPGVIEAEWERRRDAILSGVKPEDLLQDHGRYLTLRGRIEELEGALRRLDRELPNEALPLGDAPWAAAFASRAAQRREEILQKTVGSVPRDKDVPGVDDQGFQERWQAQCGEWRSWRTGLAEASAAMAKVQRALQELHLLDERPWGGANPTLRETYDAAAKGLEGEPVLVAALKPIPERTAELRRVDGLAEPQSLIDAAEKSDFFGARWAAWWRLGKLAAWPGSQGDMDRDAKVQARLADEVRTIADEARRAELGERLSQEGSARRGRGGLTASIRLVESSGDRILKGYGEYVRAGLKRAEGDAAAHAKRLSELVEEATSLGKFVAESWRNVDQKLFASESDVQRKFDGTVTEAVLRGWLAEAPGYIILGKEKDPRRPSEWASSLAIARQRLDMARASPDAAIKKQGEDCEPLHRKLKSDSEALAGLPWIARNEAAVTRAIDPLTQGLRELERKLPKDDVAQWLTQIRELAEISSVKLVNEEWRQRRDALAPRAVTVDVLKAHPERYLALRQDVDRLCKFLVDLSKTEDLPPGLPDVAGTVPECTVRKATADAVARTREEALRTLIGKAFAPNQNAPSHPFVEFRQSTDYGETCQAYSRWREAAGALLAVWHGLVAQLDAGCLPDEKPSTSLGPGPANASGTIVQIVDWWEKQSVPGELRPCFQPAVDRAARLARLQRIGDRKLLVEEAGKPSESDGPQAPIIVWRKLGEAKDWPSDLGELRLESAVREAAARANEKLRPRNPDLARRMDEALAREGPRRWEAGFNALASRVRAEASSPPSGLDDAEVVSALKLADKFAVVPERLSPVTLFRLYLRDLRERAAKLGEDAKKDALVPIRDDFRRKVTALPDGLAARPSVAEFLKALDGIVDRKEAGDGAPGAGDGSGGLGKAGPTAGPAGRWSQTADPKGEWVEYVWQERNHSLRFRRVQADGMRPSYLCTTEVSVGLAIDAVAAADKWDDFRKAIRLARIAERDRRTEPDPRKGPRAWDATPGEEATLVLNRREWLVKLPGGEPYPDGQAPKPPTPDSPMQYVTPEAALYLARLLGCRLPTAAEWRQACALHGSAQPEGERNLRDKCWLRQKEHAQARIALGLKTNWPDDDVFCPPGMSVKVGTEAQPVTVADDRLLWFADATPSSDFRHLVGNVAEFVFDDPSGFDEKFRDLAALTPQALASFLSEGKAKLGVIGGSALSPPEAWNGRDKPFDRALAVGLEAPPNGYSDVGFRLAFTAPTGTPIAAAKAFLVRNGYLAELN